MSGGSKFNIRAATAADSTQLSQLYLDAFPADEGASVGKLAGDLLGARAGAGVIALVAEVDDASVAGHVAFSPVGAVGHADWLGYILAPLAVAPAHQRCGVGASLVKAGLRWLGERPTNAVFVYGDPAYYTRFGFTAEQVENYRPPYALQFPFGWLLIRPPGARLQGEGPLSLRFVPALDDQSLW